MTPNDCPVIPTIILLLNDVRRVDESDARRVVALELGDEVGQTVRTAGENSAGMSYLTWRVGPTPYHLGTSSEPYISVLGIGKMGSAGTVGDLKWTMREEVPPAGENLPAAWMSHTAWLYVDALLFDTPSSDHDRHRRNVLRIAGRLLDERCVLVWFVGREPKRVALPTPSTRAALLVGEWPDGSIDLV